MQFKVIFFLYHHSSSWKSKLSIWWLSFDIISRQVDGIEWMCENGTMHFSELLYAALFTEVFICDMALDIPDERDEVTSRPVPRPRHCTIDEDQNERRKIMRNQEPSNPKRFLCDRNESYLITISVFLLNIFTHGLAACQFIRIKFRYLIFLVRLVFFFTQFSAVSCEFLLGCFLSLSHLSYTLSTQCHTHTPSKNRKNCMMKIDHIGGTGMHSQCNRILISFHWIFLCFDLNT